MVNEEITEIKTAETGKSANPSSEVETLTAESHDSFLEVDGLCKYFTVDTDFIGRPTKFLKAVDNVSFKVQKGKTLGIVGESGCGKTTLGRTILRLYDVTRGDVWFKGQKVTDLKNREFDKLRPNMQMIFQDPYASLSPRITVGEIIGEAALQHKIVEKSAYHDYILSVMDMCGLQPHYFERYPHEFSGGQRQRICIARALALKPELVVCDEPVSALDVSIQAQIINMLIELRKTLGLTYLFISHDLSVVKHISDEVGVMYLGTMMEYGSNDAIFNHTLHPYTRALFSAVPVPNPHVKMNRIILRGDIPSPVNPPKGCKFHTRCENCMDICTKAAPPFKEVEKGHFCACHLYTTEEEQQQLLIKAEDEEKKLAEEEAKKITFKKVWGTVTEKVKDVIKKDKPEESKAENSSNQPAETVSANKEDVTSEQIAEVPAPAESPVAEIATEKPAAKAPAKEPASQKVSSDKTEKPAVNKSAPARKTSASANKKPAQNSSQKGTKVAKAAPANKSGSAGAKKPAAKSEVKDAEEK